MNRTTSRRAAASLASLLLLGLGAGCGRRTDGSAYVPTAPTARQSLDAALAAWKDGKPPGRIDSVTPPVQVVDTAWMNGQKLSGYEVLGEESADGMPKFSVRLSLKDAKESKDQEVRYVVHGRDPVWVYREDDFARVINMDNNPEPKPARPARRR